MIPVNNKKVIHKIARSQAKGNRNRNRLLLAAIILVTFLLTTVMSVGINYFKTTQERSASLGGGNVQGVMNGPSEKQLNTLRKEATIKTVGVSSMVGGIDQIGDDEVNVILLWGDNVYWNKQKKPATVEFKGHYPKAEDEILLSRKALKKMNITKPQLGMKLTVHGAFSYNGEFQQTFRLAGIYNDYTTSPMGFVSKKFWKVSGSKLDDVATTSANLNFSTPFFDQKDAKPLEKKLNFRERQYFSYDTRMANNLIKMIAALTTISLVIMICAYLVIYNILYIRFFDRQAVNRYNVV